MDITRGVFVSMPCPSCGYGVDVELLSVRLEERGVLSMLQNQDPAYRR